MSDETGKVLLARARSGMTPSQRDRERMRGRLLASLGVAAAAGTSTAAAASSGTLGSTKLALVFLGVLGLLGAGALVHRANQTAIDDATAPASSEVEVPEPEHVASAHVVPDHVASDHVASAHVASAHVAPEHVAPEPRDLVAAETPSAPDVAEAPSEEAAARMVPRRSRGAALETATEIENPAPVDSLAEETALIAQARTALRAHEPRAALAALDEHARRFPHGALSEERDIQRIRAYCGLGDRSRAAAEVQRFRRMHPSSLHSVEGCEAP